MYVIEFNAIGDLFSDENDSTLLLSHKSVMSYFETLMYYFEKKLKVIIIIETNHDILTVKSVFSM